MTADNKHHTLEGLRARLFATLDGVRSGTMDLDRARAVNDIGRTLIESAKVEVAYLEATGGDESKFITNAPPEAPDIETPPKLPNGITGIVQHRLKG